MPVIDDTSITDDAILYRVLHPGWTCSKNGRYRPQSMAFTDGRSKEVSCFIAGEGVEEKVRSMFPGLEIATVSARVVRESGFAIERRPTECEEFSGDPKTHVVIGSPTGIPNKEYERCARKIAVHAATSILPQR